MPRTSMIFPESTVIRNEPLDKANSFMIKQRQLLQTLVYTISTLYKTMLSRINARTLKADCQEIFV